MFELANDGRFVKEEGDDETKPQHPQDVDDYAGWDIYRLRAEVEEGTGWHVEVPNALAVARFGTKAIVKVAVRADTDSDRIGHVQLTATSESDPSAKAKARCQISR